MPWRYRLFVLTLLLVSLPGRRSPTGLPARWKATG